jgi:hypothetical protein
MKSLLLDLMNLVFAHQFSSHLVDVDAQFLITNAQRISMLLIATALPPKSVTNLLVLVEETSTQLRFKPFSAPNNRKSSSQLPTLLSLPLMRLLAAHAKTLFTQLVSMPPRSESSVFTEISVSPSAFNTLKTVALRKLQEVAVTRTVLIKRTHSLDSVIMLNAPTSPLIPAHLLILLPHALHAQRHALLERKANSVIEHARI